MSSIQEVFHELEDCQRLLTDLIAPKNYDCSYKFLQNPGVNNENGVPHLDLKTIHDKLQNGKYQNRYELAADIKLMLEEYCWNDRSRWKFKTLFKKVYEKVFGEEITREFATSDLKFYLFERVLALPSNRLENVAKILEYNRELPTSSEYDVEVDKLPIPMLYKLKAYIDSIPDGEFHNGRYFEQNRDSSKNQSVIMSISERLELSEKIDRLSNENRRNMFQLIRRYEPIPTNIRRDKLSQYLSSVRFSNIWKLKGYTELLYAQGEEAEEKLMSEEEKANLCDKLLHMDPKNIQKVCDRVNELEPSVPSDINEIFFCFHSLKDTTLKAIERLVNCIG